MRVISLISALILVACSATATDYHAGAEMLKNWGLFNNFAKSHVNAVEAWRLQDGSRKIVVAVVDTGVDAKHPDLSQNLWEDQEAELPCNGWNFIVDSCDVWDENGHGTHVAGIIGASLNLYSGSSGVAHNVSLLSVKYYSNMNSGMVNLQNTVKAINYAINHKARIINYSGGGPEFSEDEYLAVKNAEVHDVLFVAAAGNEHQNTDLVENYYYPSAYRVSNIISVAATDIKNNLLASSNWGKTKVDVAAPGENIYSTLPGGRYGYMSGTSQATAFVSGIAALILSERPCLKPKQVKDIIVKSVDKIPQLARKVASGGRVNAYAALLRTRDIYTQTCKLKK